MLEKINYFDSSNLDKERKKEEVKICFCPIKSNFLEYKSQIDQQIKTIFCTKNQQIIPDFSDAKTIFLSPINLDDKPNEKLRNLILKCPNIKSSDHLLFDFIEEIDYLSLTEQHILFYQYYQSCHDNYLNAIRRTVEQKTNNRLSIYFTFILKNIDGEFPRIITQIPSIYEEGSLKTLL